MKNFFYEQFFFINQTKEITLLLLTISTYNFKQTVEKYIHKTTTKTKIGQDTGLLPVGFT